MPKILTKIFAIIALTLAGGVGAKTKTPPALDASRTVVIDTVILPGSLVGIGRHLLAAYYTDPTKPVDIILDTPGGSVMEGLDFIAVMKEIKSQGGIVRCTVANNAHSMGFTILTECSERYALTTAFVMWHFPRSGVGQPLAADEFLKIGKSLKVMELELLNKLQKVIPLPAAVVKQRYYDEEFQSADTLDKETKGAFFTGVFEGIPGLLLIKAHAQTPRMEHPRSMGLFGELFPGLPIH